MKPIKRRSRKVTGVDVVMISMALDALNDARKLLRAAEANRAADYVARASKSVEGAYKHAKGQRSRQRFQAQQLDASVSEA